MPLAEIDFESVVNLIIYGVVPTILFGGLIFFCVAVVRSSRRFQANVTEVITKTLANQETSIELQKQSLENQQQIIRLLEKLSSRSSLT